MLPEENSMGLSFDIVREIEDAYVKEYFEKHTFASYRMNSVGISTLRIQENVNVFL